ncbi:hypothetical protein JKF63_04286 [Porcisia hertigi]|uniref:Uncharacterized protein n=1 Tax=Porcisia hertigi TaxID=2761500 RepID=A0A836IS70_9TRYP|nr:hypothetical protein JKF63_04286 [Porcisia hertigi]
MSHSIEGFDDGLLPAEVQLPTSPLSSSAVSCTAQHPGLVAGRFSSVSSSLSSGNVHQNHVAVVDELHMHMRSATATPPQSSSDAVAELRATEARLRQAQEAELSVLVRLQLLTQGLISALHPSTSVGAVGKETTAAHGSGDVEEDRALANEGTFQASLPTVIAYPPRVGAGGVTHTQLDTCIVMRRVAMPLAGLSAATREQYTVLHDILARHFCNLDGSTDRACGLAVRNVCAPAARTPQHPQFIGQCDATPPALISQISQAVNSSGVAALTAPCTVAEEGARAAGKPAARHLDTVEAQWQTHVFPRKVVDCPPYPPQQLRSLHQHPATGGFPKLEASTETTGSLSNSRLRGTRVHDSPPTPSHGSPDRFAVEKTTYRATETVARFPDISRVCAVEGVSAELAADEVRTDAREDGGVGHSSQGECGRRLALSTPTAPASVATTPADKSLSCVVKGAPCGPMLVCAPPLTGHRDTPGGPREGGGRDSLEEQATQDTPTPPPSPRGLKSSPHRLSQPLSATPPSDFDDAGEEEMYFPTPPLRAHRGVDSGPGLSTQHRLMSDNGRAYRGSGGGCASPKASNRSAPSTTLRLHVAPKGDHYEGSGGGGGGESTRALESERCTGVVVGSSTHAEERGHAESLQTASVKHDAHVSLPLPGLTCVSTATDILATITPLPLPSPSSLPSRRALARSAHRGGKVPGAARKWCVGLADDQRTQRGAYKRMRREGDGESRVDMDDRIFRPKPLAGLPSLGVDVSWTAAAALDQSVCGELNDARHRRSAIEHGTRRNGLEPTMFKEEHASGGYVRTRERRIEDVAHAERVFGAVRAACGPLPPASSQVLQHAHRDNAECDISEPLPSPPLSQNTPHQFWDILFP